MIMFFLLVIIIIAHPNLPHIQVELKSNRSRETHPHCWLWSVSFLNTIMLLLFLTNQILIIVIDFHQHCDLNQHIELVLLCVRAQALHTFKERIHLNCCKKNKIIITLMIM